MKAMRKFLINQVDTIKNLIYYQKVLLHYIDVRKDNKPYKAKIPILVNRASIAEIKKLYRNPDMELKVYPWNFLREKYKRAPGNALLQKAKKNSLVIHFQVQPK